MEGFNNLEQGVLIACAVFATGGIMWLAITIPSACLRTIDIAHHLKRMAEATADAQLEMVRIANLLENPPVTIEESAESVARRREAEEAANAAPVLQAFGNMTPEERAAKRRARRIEACEIHKGKRWRNQMLESLGPDEDTVTCNVCTGVARVIRPVSDNPELEGIPAYLSDFT